MSLACGDCVFCTMSDKENISICKKTGKILSEKYVNGWYIPEDLNKPGFCDNFISRFKEEIK